MRGKNLRMLRGALVLSAVAGAIALFLSRAEVRASCRRTAEVIVRAFFPAAAPTITLEVPWPYSPGVTSPVLEPGVLLVGFWDVIGGSEAIGEVTAVRDGSKVGTKSVVISVLPGKWDLLHSDLAIDVVFPPRDTREALGFVFDEAFFDELEMRFSTDISDLFDRALRPEIVARSQVVLKSELPADPEIEAFFRDDLLPRARERFAGPLDEVQKLLVTRLKAEFNLWGRTKLVWNLLMADEQTLRSKLLPIIAKALADFWDSNREDVVKRSQKLMWEYEPEVRAWFEEKVAPAFLRDVILPVYRQNAYRLGDIIERHARFAAESRVYVTLPSRVTTYRPRFAHLMRNQLLGKQEMLFFVELPGERGKPLSPGDPLRMRTHFVPGTPKGHVSLEDAR